MLGRGGVEKGVSGVVNDIELAGTEMIEQARSRGLGFAHFGEHDVATLLEKGADALAFTGRTGQVAGGIDDEEHAELLVAASRLDPFGNG